MGFFAPQKAPARKVEKDVLVLISVLNVTFIELCKSDTGCHCPDGDGI